MCFHVSNFLIKKKSQKERLIERISLKMYMKKGREQNVLGKEFPLYIYD